MPVPFAWKLESNDFGDNQRVLQRQPRVGFVDGALEQAHAYGGLVLFCDGIGGRLAPVLVDAVLELDDGEVADLEGQRLVEEDGLEQGIVATRLFPLLQLLGARLHLLRVGRGGRAQDVEQDPLGQGIGLAGHLYAKLDVHAGVLAGRKGGGCLSRGSAVGRSRAHEVKSQEGSLACKACSPRLSRQCSRCDGAEGAPTFGVWSFFHMHITPRPAHGGQVQPGKQTLVRA